MPKIYQIKDADKKHHKEEPSRLDLIIQEEFEHRLKPGTSMMIAPEGDHNFAELTYERDALTFGGTPTFSRGGETRIIPYEQLFQSFKAGFFTSPSSDIKPLKGSCISGFRDQRGQEYLILNETATPRPSYQKLMDLITFSDIASKDEKTKQPPKPNTPPPPPQPKSETTTTQINSNPIPKDLKKDGPSQTSLEKNTCYRLLNVSPTASQSEIKSAYSKLQVFKEDLGFPKIKAAHEVLSNPSKKLVYDHYLKTHQDHNEAMKEAQRHSTTHKVKPHKNVIVQYKNVAPQSPKDFFVYEIESTAKTTIDQLSELELKKRLNYSKEHNTPFTLKGENNPVYEKHIKISNHYHFLNGPNPRYIHHSQLIKDFQNFLFPADNPYAQTPLPDETLYGIIVENNYIVHVHKDNLEALNLIQQLNKDSCTLISAPPIEDRKAPSNLNPQPQQKPADKYQCLKEYGLFACKGMGMVLGLTTVITVNVQMALCIAALANVKHEALFKGTLGQSSLHRVGEINAGTAVGITIDVLMLVMCYVWYKHSKSLEKASTDNNSPPVVANTSK